MVWQANKGLYQTPKPLRKKSKRDKSRFYIFHTEFSYMADDFYALKGQTEELILKGYLSSYVKKGHVAGVITTVEHPKVINVIHRMRYQGSNRALRSDIKHLTHASLNLPNSMVVTWPTKIITFYEEDLQGFLTPTMTPWWYNSLLVDVRSRGF